MFYGMGTGALSILVKAGLALVFVPVFISNQSVELYGYYVFVTAIIEAVPLLELGAGVILVQAVAAASADDDRERIRSILAWGHWFYCSLAVLLGIGALIVAAVLHASASIYDAIMTLSISILPIAACELIISAYSLFFRQRLLSLSEQYFVNLSEVGGLIITLSLGLFFLTAGFSVEWVFVARLCGCILRTGLIIGRTLRVSPAEEWLHFNLSMRTLRSFSSPFGNMAVTTLSIIVSHRLDIFVIKAFLPFSDVAIYDIVFRLLSIAHQVCLKVSQNVLPALAVVLRRGDIMQLRWLLITAGRLNAAITCLSSIVLIGLLEPVLQILTHGTVSYDSALPLFVMGAVITWSGAFQIPSTYSLVSTGQTGFLAWSSAITALANFGLSLFLVSKIGLIGVVLGTLIPQTLQHQLWLIPKMLRSAGMSYPHYLWKTHGILLFPILMAAATLELMKLVNPVDDTLGRLALDAAVPSLLGSGAFLALWLRRDLLTTVKELSS